MNPSPSNYITGHKISFPNCVCYRALNKKNIRQVSSSSDILNGVQWRADEELCSGKITSMVSPQISN